MIDDEFGHAVAVNGETVAVGMPGDDYAGAGDHGAAYVFIRSGGTWTQQARLTASDAGWYDRFGGSLAIQGDTTLIGTCRMWGSGAWGDADRAYLFARSGGTWTEEAILTGSDTLGGDRFGASVALDGDTAVVGAAEDDHPGATNAGSAYAFGLNCAVVGDLDGDGDVDRDDYDNLADCLGEPGVAPLPGCEGADLDGDLDVDLADFAAFQTRFGM